VPRPRPPSGWHGEPRERGSHLTILSERLSGPAAAGAEALDFAGFRRRYVVRTPSHLAHEPLLLHFPTELPKGLLELLGVLDNYPHNPPRIAGEQRRAGL
jgi:hypothetical protein